MAILKHPEKMGFKMIRKRKEKKKKMNQWVIESMSHWVPDLLIHYSIPCFQKDSIFQNSLYLIWQKFNIPLFQRDFSCSKFPLIISKNIKHSSVTKSFLLFKINLSFQFFLDQSSRAKQSCWIKVKKLDGVGPVYNKPSTDKLHHFVRKKINK